MAHLAGKPGRDPATRPFARPGFDGVEGKWYFPSMATSTTFLTLDKKGRTTFPEEVRQALGVGAGDFLLLERTDRGTYELVPATLVPNDQLWFHHPEMQDRLRRAEEEIASGRLTRTQTPADAQDFLDSLKVEPRPGH